MNEIEIFKAKHSQFDYCLVVQNKFLQWENEERLLEILSDMIRFRSPFTFCPNLETSSEPKED